MYMPAHRSEIFSVFNTGIKIARVTEGSPINQVHRDPDFFYDRFRHTRGDARRAAHMGIAHTIRICDRISRRLSLLLTRENCANKCVFRAYITGCYISYLQNRHLLYIFSGKNEIRQIGSLSLNKF